MNAPYSKDELIDLLMEFKQEKYPGEPLTREQADALVDDVRADGKVIYSDAGQANFAFEAILGKLALSVISSLIGAAIKAGGVAAWKAWIGRPSEEVVKDLHPPADPEKRTICITTIIFIQEKKVDAIAQHLVDRGRLAP